MLAKGQEEATAHSTSEEPSNTISDMLLRGNKGVAAGDGGTEEEVWKPNEQERRIDERNEKLRWAWRCN